MEGAYALIGIVIIVILICAITRSDGPYIY